MNKCQSSSVLQDSINKKWGAFLPILIVVFLRNCVCFGNVFENVPRAELTLRFLSIIHRHGERAPTLAYPLDPYKNESFWQDGQGQLLKKGKVSLFELGKFLRYRYDGFIPPKYRSTDVYVLSSPYDRCLMSVEALLAGLYPPVGDQIWNAELPWQPIPVHTLPTSVDDMLRVKRTCPLLSKEEEYVEANFLRPKLSENQELIHFLSNNTGLEFTSIKNISRMYDNLFVTSLQGFKLPEWTRDIYPDKLKSLAMLRYLSIHDTFTMRRLFSGNYDIRNTIQYYSKPMCIIHIQFSAVAIGSTVIATALSFYHNMRQKWLFSVSTKMLLLLLKMSA